MKVLVYLEGYLHSPLTSMLIENRHYKTNDIVKPVTMRLSRMLAAWVYGIFLPRNISIFQI